MAFNDGQSPWLSLVYNQSIKNDYLDQFNSSTYPSTAVSIAFNIGRGISFLCIIFGILGNTTLILIITHSAFRHLPYGLFLLLISTFDILRLLSTTFYYLIQGHAIPLTLSTTTVYVAWYRYSKIVTNWIKVFLAIERLYAVNHWRTHRYNINCKNSKRINHSRQRQSFLLIVGLLLCSLIIQHPNFIPFRFVATFLDPNRLLIVNIPNRYFYYGRYVFNGLLFTIITYIILDDLLPIIILMVCNTILLYQLKHLPALTSKKLTDSVLILSFLTVFSIFEVPRSFIVLLNLYANPRYINDTVISIVFHTIQGLEMINHAITGYACFLSCRTLRKELIKNVQLFIQKLPRLNKLR